jgi:hypothetical protein
MAPMTPVDRSPVVREAPRPRHELPAVQSQPRSIEHSAPPPRVERAAPAPKPEVRRLETKRETKEKKDR